MGLRQSRTVAVGYSIAGHQYSTAAPIKAPRLQVDDVSGRLPDEPQALTQENDTLLMSNVNVISFSHREATDAASGEAGFLPRVRAFLPERLIRRQGASWS